MACNCCNEDSCVNVNLFDLDELLYRINQESVKLSKRVENSLLWDFPIGDQSLMKLHKLNLYKDTLQRYSNRLMVKSKQCVCPTDIQSLIERIKSLVGGNYFPSRYEDPQCREDIIIDSSQVDSWVAANPFCVSREKWEELAYKICGAIKLEITSEEFACGIAFDIVKETFPCGLMAGLSIAQRACELGWTVNRSADECKLDWKLLHENHPDCDVSLDTYMSLVTESNMTYDTINEMCSAKVRVEQPVKIPSDPVLITVTGNKYSLQELQFQSAITNEDLKLLDGIVETKNIDVIKFKTDYKK